MRSQCTEEQTDVEEHEVSPPECAEDDSTPGNRVELRKNPGRGRRDDRHLPNFATSRPHVIKHNISETHSDTTSSDRQRRWRTNCWDVIFNVDIARLSHKYNCMHECRCINTIISNLEPLPQNKKPSQCIIAKSERHARIITCP